jgi:hypothetical protein
LPTLRLYLSTLTHSTDTDCQQFIKLCDYTHHN